MPNFTESQWQAIQERHAAEVAYVRETLSQAQSWIAMLEADLTQATDSTRSARAEVDALRRQLAAAQDGLQMALVTRSQVVIERDDLRRQLAEVQAERLYWSRYQGELGADLRLLDAEVADLRRQLDAAQAQCRLYVGDIARLCDEANAASAQWDAVPWAVIYDICYPTIGYAQPDDIADLRTWYGASKPDGVQA